MNSTPQPLGSYWGDVTMHRGAPPMLSLCLPTLTNLAILMGITIAVQRPACQSYVSYEVVANVHAFFVVYVMNVWA